MSYPNWIYSAFSFLGFVLCAIPFPWHLEAWNTGTCLYMAWTGLFCLNLFINSVIWNNDAINRAPVWCDISSRLYIGVNVAVPAASLCINRRLYHISSCNSVTTTQAEKRRAVMVDLAIGLGIPILEMILAYIPQGHRFDIYEQIGCYPAIYSTPVAIALVNSWPVIIGLVSAVYCVLSIRAFYKRRLQFKEILSSNRNLSSGRYFRLMCLAGVEVLGTIPAGIFVLVTIGKEGINPWKGWADTHFDFSKVEQWPAFIWRTNPILTRALEMSRWSPVACAIIFFAFFGFADEARRNYRAAFTSIAKRMGYTTAMSSTLNNNTSVNVSHSWFKKITVGSATSNSTSRGGLPIYVTKETNRKRESLDSFTSSEFRDSSFKEKSFGASFGAISVQEVYKLSPPSPSSSDAQSIDVPSPVEDDDDIEVSSIRRLSTASAIIVPPPVLNLSNVPRHHVDLPGEAV